MAELAAANRFLADFALPLLEGGPVKIDGLVGPGLLSNFRNVAALDGTLVSKLTDRMRGELARIGPAGTLHVPCSDALALLAVWYNLLAVTHPEASPSAGLRRRVREWTVPMLEWVGRPRTADEVAQRHALLARFAQLGRVDTEVTFWAGYAKFIGAPPPNRLVAWETVRRVKQTRTRFELFDLLAELGPGKTGQLPSLLDLAHQALALSPLTDLALIERPALPFVWTGPTVDLLADHSLRGAAVRLLLGRLGGAGTAEVAAARVRLAERATLDALSKGAPQPALKELVRLHLELLLTEGLARGAPAQGFALGWDLAVRLGAQRVSAVTGLDKDEVVAALGFERGQREPNKDVSALGLIMAAGLAAEA